jgi:hypothetical protein
MTNASRGLRYAVNDFSRRSGVEPMVHRSADTRAMANAAGVLLRRLYDLDHRGRPLTVRERAERRAVWVQARDATFYCLQRHQDARVRALADLVTRNEQ